MIEKNVRINLWMGVARKGKLVYKKINKRSNRRHLTTYLSRKLNIYRESNYKIRRTVLLRNVYEDSIHTDQHGNVEQFNSGLVMYLVSHT